MPKSAKRMARSRPPEPFIPKPAAERPRVPAVKAPKRGTSAHSQLVHDKTQQALADKQEAHFRVGNKEVYFPHGKVVLLRPSAKATPFQAKFLVPRNFNKMDLRDYLFHVYGLRALNVTTQLQWARWKRVSPVQPRYRTTQQKKMTIEMEDPFVWPEPIPDTQIRAEFMFDVEANVSRYRNESLAAGARRLRKPTAFGGLLGPYPEAPAPYVPRKTMRRMDNKVKAAADAHKKAQDVAIVKQFLGMA